MRLPRLCIKLNNTPVATTCELCGCVTALDVGPALFVEGAWSPVCDDCGRARAPNLQRLLEQAPTGMTAPSSGRSTGRHGTLWGHGGGLSSASRTRFSSGSD
jgi:hypothetical protein